MILVATILRKWNFCQCRKCCWIGLVQNFMNAPQYSIYPSAYSLFTSHFTCNFPSDGCLIAVWHIAILQSLCPSFACRQDLSTMFDPSLTLSLLPQPYTDLMFGESSQGMSFWYLFSLCYEDALTWCLGLSVLMVPQLSSVPLDIKQNGELSVVGRIAVVVKTRDSANRPCCTGQLFTPEWLVQHHQVEIMWLRNPNLRFESIFVHGNGGQ